MSNVSRGSPKKVTEKISVVALGKHKQIVFLITTRIILCGTCK